MTQSESRKDRRYFVGDTPIENAGVEFKGVPLTSEMLNSMPDETVRALLRGISSGTGVNTWNTGTEATSVAPHYKQPARETPHSPQSRTSGKKFAPPPRNQR